MSDIDTLTARLNQETARIRWHELQPFFARGQTVRIDPGLDLVSVATAFAEDHREQVQSWMQDQRVGLVSDDESATWLAADQEVWAVVVAPWVLVQPITTH